MEIRKVEFNSEIVPDIRHLCYRENPFSGMNQWFRSLETGEPSEYGIPPKYIFIAYEHGDVAVGWCGIGRYNDTMGIINTYVFEDNRGKGIARALAEATLVDYSESKNVMVDNASWSKCAEIIRTKGLRPIGWCSGQEVYVGVA